MEFGLKRIDLEYIIKTIEKFPEIEKAIIFGSRAKGNYKPGSDIDIAIYGEKINFDIVSKLHSNLEEKGPMPYFFDVVDVTHINHKELKEHIERVGKIIYSRIG
ncbi:nucleotidyltransferase domain-containing protein [Clostridium chromiireducens]|uniref:Nucleotidyltransferase domain protein n=1 Tax=Clostridium chromiireducens TaxID=225345 RepID=A0A1V4IZI4_9CLOT|nr:nucleotidyltransferase domain-containing protein [Clostridium chromiireducens]OPJ65309.1 nucleotidyltransferase domain protein [Clostridium chromiireducens]